MRPDRSRQRGELAVVLVEGPDQEVRRLPRRRIGVDRALLTSVPPGG